MHHGIKGSNLSRSKNERTALRRILLRDLFMRGSIITTHAKARAIRGIAEKLITKAKRRNNSDLTKIQSILTDKRPIRVLLSDAKERFSKRSSGYTRIVALGKRRGDSATQVVLTFVDEKISKSIIKNEPKKDSKKSVEKTSKI